MRTIYVIPVCSLLACINIDFDVHLLQVRIQMLESSNTIVMAVIFHAIKSLRLFAFRVIYHCTESKDMLAHVLLPIYKYFKESLLYVIVCQFLIMN